MTVSHVPSVSSPFIVIPQQSTVAKQQQEAGITFVPHHDLRARIYATMLASGYSVQVYKTDEEGNEILHKTTGKKIPMTGNGVYTQPRSGEETPIIAGRRIGNVSKFLNDQLNVYLTLVGHPSDFAGWKVDMDSVNGNGSSS